MSRGGTVLSPLVQPQAVEQQLGQIGLGIGQHRMGCPQINTNNIGRCTQSHRSLFLLAGYNAPRCNPDWTLRVPATYLTDFHFRRRHHLGIGIAC